MNKVLAGLQIIAKYDEDFEVHAGHDEILAGPGIEISKEDTEKMKELGWTDEEGDGWRVFT